MYTYIYIYSWHFIAHIKFSDRKKENTANVKNKQLLYRVGKNILPGGTATISNRTYNEFYTKRKPVKNGI